MPRYEYQCPHCNTCVALTRTIAERNNEVLCPECQFSSPMERIWSTSHFILKGPGFYVNDYKRTETA